nr:uncharacterized protein LOC117681324 isoform X4 [Crassostrea gigas]
MGKSNEEDQHQHISPMPTVKIGNNKQFSDSAEMDHLAVQKGYLFMLEHIHEEPQLVCYLCHLCESPLSDDKKKDMLDGKGYFKKRELLKCLISKGESACKEFLEKFKCYQNLYSQFFNAVQSVTNADGIQQDVFLTHDKLPHFERVLLEEMEPTPVGDILYCHAVLSSDEHDEIDEMSNKREKAMKLLTKIGQQPDKIAVFCHALEQSKCSRAVEYIRNNPSNGPLHSSEMSAVKFVRFNFRKNLKYFKDCVSKKKLLDYLEINGCKVTSTGELVPNESFIIKTALRNGKPWCDCILECFKKTDFVFLKKLVGRLEKRRKDGRDGVDLQFNVKMMKDMEDCLLDELDPARISNVLLEEEAFSIDDHDQVENTRGRRKKAEALCGILLRDGSELTMESFSYALRKNQYITNEIRRRQSGQQPITQQRPTNQSDIQIRDVGRAPENVEEIQAASGLDVLMSIPVQDGDVEELQQKIDQLNINPDFHAEVLSSHVMVRSISLGSVVLRLIALTDDACQMLFDENGKKMKTLIETFLRFSNIKEDMIKGNIKVTVSVPEEETGNKLPTDDEIKIRGNWNLLVEELEPSTMAKKLFEKHVFNEDDTQKISSMKTRKEKVETLLSLLLSKQREVKNTFDAFIRSLDELGKGDIAVKIKPSEKMHQEAEKVRLGLLSKFAEAVDEIESSHMEETFELCGIDKHSVNFISSESGKSRKDRALQFLTYVLLNDAYVLGIEKVLNDRGLNWLLEYPKDRNFADQLMGAKRKRRPGEVLYQCQYEVERKEMRIADLDLTETDESSMMDWEGVQKDEPEPKHYAPKKRLQPKPRPTYQTQVAIPPKKIFGQSGEDTSKDTIQELEEKTESASNKVLEEMREVEDSHINQKAASSESDWESSSLIESKRQPDESKPKHFEPKKRHVKLKPKSRSMYQAQAAVQPKRIFGHPGDDGSKEEWSIVVALDFGTTYSGYAFWKKDTDPLDITSGKWNTGSKNVLESLKTPTSLLLSKENEVIEFGFEAEKIFKELAEDGSDKEYRFFRQFKMLLHDRKSFNTDMLIEDHQHNPIKALDVFSLSIQYLKDECFELFQKKHINIPNDEILWILTVPAIWDQSAKEFMRKAAEQAEIPSEQLKLALEPEAAAIYVVKGAKTTFGKESVTTVKPGTKIMVADLGGGTAVITVLELNEDKTMKQLHRSFGLAWGGNLINEKIWKIMTNVFGEEIIDEFKKLTSDFLDMESIIELRKRDISTGSKLQLQILPSLADLCKTIKGKGYKQLVTESGYTNVKVRTGKIIFEPDLVEEIFDLTLTKVYTIVEKVLHNQNMKGIKDIILVGGFAHADFIVRQFKEKLSGYNVIIPTDPVLAVLKGAVMFGQDIDIISSRITAHTYGFDAMRHFRDGDLKSKKRKIDNTIYCVDLFEKVVAIGESVDVGKTFEKEVFASSKEMKSMVLKFYQSEIKNPTYVTDPGCQCIGKLSVEMPDLSGGTERSVMVSIKFGETEITVCSVDKTTGKKQETVLDLLGDTK